jgi:hypothetical protein
VGPEGFEKMLGRDVERHVLAAIRSVATNGQPARPDDFDWLVSYMALQVVRTPYYMARLQEHLGMRRANELLAHAFTDQAAFFRRLAGLRWTLWKTRRGLAYFWISDDPVSASTESGEPLDMTIENLDREDSVVHMPLTKRLALVGSHSGKHAQTFDVDDSDFVGFLNALTLRSGGTEIYGPARPFMVKRLGRLIALDDAADDLWRRASEESG